MASCRRVLFLVTQDKGSMSLSYEQFKQKKRSNRMKIQKYTHIKKKEKKRSLITTYSVHVLVCGNWPDAKT